MGRIFAVFLTSVVVAISALELSYAQEDIMGVEGQLILRRAQEKGKITVAVEAYLMENILEARITARMYGTKPQIYNAIIVGPKLGRLSSESRQTLLASTEEDVPYPTDKKERGFISFGTKTETKKSSGTLTRELIQFRIPRDKIAKGKRYRLWVQVESLQRGGKYKTFKFDLENLTELLSQYL